MNKQLRQICLLVSVFIFPGISLQAKPFLPDSDLNPDYNIEVISSDINETIIKFSLNRFSDETRWIGSERFTNISLSQSGRWLEKGLPELPKISVPIQLTSSDKPVVEVLSKSISDWDLGVPAPSSGDIERNQKPVISKSLAFYNSAVDTWFPKSFMTEGKPYQLGGSHGMTLTLSPFIYNPKPKTTQVLSELTIRIRSGVNASLLKESFKATMNQTTEPMSQVYKNHYLNHNHLLETSGLKSSSFAANRGKLLIISHTDFFDTMIDFAIWKRQLGFEVILVSQKDAGTSPEQLKQFVQGQYDKDQTLGYLILVGDAEFIPFHPGTAGNAIGNEADPMYGLLEGQDSYPEIPVARFSVKTKTELQTILEKGYRYEKYPETLNWFGQATNIASDEGIPTDAERADVLRDMLLGSTFYHVDQIYDPGARPSEILAALNSGRSLVNYIGHGTERDWITGYFDRGHIRELKNFDKFPLIVSVACVNGRFAWSEGDSFAEVWSKAGTPDSPTGALAIFASSTNQTWVPPTWGQKKINELISKGQPGLIGPLLMSGSIEVLNRGDYSAVQTFQTWHTFGDPTIEFKLHRPQSISMVVAPERSVLAQNRLILGKPGIRATFSTPQKMYITKLSNQQGVIEFDAAELEDLKSLDLTLTLSGSGMIPVSSDFRID